MHLTHIHTPSSTSTRVLVTHWRHSEWSPTLAINHSNDSVELNSWTARFFVNECRKSLCMPHATTPDSLLLSLLLHTDNNRFADAAAESQALIYQHTPKYTGETGAFTQMYLFPL